MQLLAGPWRGFIGAVGALEDATGSLGDLHDALLRYAVPAGQQHGRIVRRALQAEVQGTVQRGLRNLTQWGWDMGGWAKLGSPTSTALPVFSAGPGVV